MGATTTDEQVEVEDVESFRLRARAWLKDNMPRATKPMSGMGGGMTDEEELAEIQHCRELQRLLYDGGFAGLCIPKAYEGQGLTPAHMRAFVEEIDGYEFPYRIQIPNFTPCAAVILEFGTEEQKRQHIPAILKGEEIWMQMLSEPSGGSDVAGAQTTAVRDGDEWVINGSKIWTTGAWWADWALLLARTNPDVQKHRGLSVFLFKIHQPGVEVNQIEMLDGNKDFCQEFITDVRIPDSDRVGEVDDGWTVGIRWMFYERSFALSPLIIPVYGGESSAGRTNLVSLARKAGRLDDPIARDLIGEAHALSVAQKHVTKRIMQGMMTRRFNDQAASLSRLMSGVVGRRTNTISYELAGPAAVAWDDEEDADLGRTGVRFLSRQAGEIGGGTTEMARNVISERVLGMPRERMPDRDLPFRDVPKGPTNR